MHHLPQAMCLSLKMGSGLETERGVFIVIGAAALSPLMATLDVFSLQAEQRPPCPSKQTEEKNESLNVDSSLLLRKTQLLA